MSERSCSPPVYGIETEYTCMIKLPGDIVHEYVDKCHTKGGSLGLYRAPTTKGSSAISRSDINYALEKMGIYATRNGMLSNGGRYYIDPSGPEYATPETSTAAEAAERSFEGDKIALGIFEVLRRSGTIKGYQINRRNVDHNRSSRGIHLNTVTKLTRTNPAPIVKDWMATLNVVKGAIFGSGGLLVDESGQTAYHHSPRLSITSTISANYEKYKRRPLVRHPFKADGTQLSRVETVTSDALNFGWPLRASLVATNALTGVIEMGYGNRLPRLKDSVSAAHAVGRCGNETRITAIDRRGREMTVRPLDVMRIICETELEIDDTEEHLDKESAQVIPEIIDVSDRMDDDMYGAASQVESVMRLLAMQRKMEKKGVKLDSDTMCRFDYAWDWVGGGIAERLRNEASAGWHGFDDARPAAASSKRLAMPPQDTRAKVRGDMIKRSRGNNESSWVLTDMGDEMLYIHPLCHQVRRN